VCCRVPRAPRRVRRGAAPGVGRAPGGVPGRAPRVVPARVRGLPGLPAGCIPGLLEARGAWSSSRQVSTGAVISETATNPAGS
jgi:hypothetical protein